MKDSLNHIGNNLLSQLSNINLEEQISIGKINRRTFIAGAALLGASCRAAEPLIPMGKRTGMNSNYRTPNVSGARPVMPDSHNSGGKTSNFTYSRALVSGNQIALTFDDGPHPTLTPRLLSILAQRKIVATFYVIGRNVDTYPQILRDTVAAGHEIGNHSYTHPLLSKLSDDAIKNEIGKTQEAIGRASNIQPRTLRPPYGGLNMRQREMVHNTFNLPSILWDVDPLDWKRPGPSVVQSRITSGTRSGSIVLAHDIHAGTIDAMPATLDNLLAKGFEFVTISQLIALNQAKA